MRTIKLASIYLLAAAIIFLVLGIYTALQDLDFSAITVLQSLDYNTIVESISVDAFDYHKYLHLIFFFMGFLALSSIYFAEKIESKILSQANADLQREITERKQAEEEKERLEEQLLQARKLESIGVLADGMAHDFNNLLGGILGNIDIAKDDLEPGSDVYNILSEAEKECMRAKDLTQQFRIISQDVVPVKEIDSLVEIIKDTTSTALKGSKVNSELGISDNLWLVEFNKEQIAQVIDNVILNAKEAMPEGGTIKVKAQNVAIDAEKKESDMPMEEGKYVKISIQDEGTGISEDHLSKIFDPYFSTKERGTQKGMGLGMAFAYSVVKKHNGYIYVNSKISAGTTVNIYIPAFEEKVR